MVLLSATGKVDTRMKTKIVEGKNAQTKTEKECKKSGEGIEK